MYNRAGRPDLRVSSSDEPSRTRAVATRVRDGMTLVHLLVAIVAAVLVIGSATHHGPSPSSTRRTVGLETGQHHSGGAATSIAGQRIALAEAGLVSEEPAVIYADARAFSFNTGFTSAARPDLLASFAAPRTTRSRHALPVVAGRLARRVARPAPPRARLTIDIGSDWATAFAKTVTFFFAPDSANTHVPGAFALWREVNDAAPEILVHNVLPDTVPFFVYRCAVQQTASSDSLAEVPSDRLPITFADSSGAGIDAQSLRAVEMHFLVTNGAHGASEKVERVSVLAMLPGAGHAVQPVDGSPLAPVVLFAGMGRGHRRAVTVGDWRLPIGQRQQPRG